MPLTREHCPRCDGLMRRISGRSFCATYCGSLLLTKRMEPIMPPTRARIAEDELTQLRREKEIEGYPLETVDMERTQL